MTKLVWDGAAWVRRGDGGAAERVAVDVFDRPLPPRPIGPGWWVTSATGPSEFGGHPTGLCVHVREDLDRTTGELRLVYECVEEARKRVFRLEVAHDDVLMATRATRSEVRRLAAHCHLVLGDRLRSHLLRAPRAWLVELLPALERLEASL